MFHIVFSADENYIKYLAVLLVNIIQNTDKSKTFTDFIDNKSMAYNATMNQNFSNNISGGGAAKSLETKYCDKQEGYIFHILSDSLSNDTQNKLKSLQTELSSIYPCEIQVHFVDDTIFEDFPKWGFDKQKNYTTYYRLLVSRFVPEGIEKCLILDVDALVVCDIRELFAIDLGECIVAAVDHPAPTDSNVCAESLILHSKDGESFDIKKKLPYYFCAGLMLLNMPLYRVNNIESQCLDFLRHYIPVHPEQDALNVVLNGKIMILPEEYGFLLANVYVKGYETYIHKLPYAKIVHYNARAKPWNTPAQNLKSHSKFIIRYPYYKQWWAYALQTPILAQNLRKSKYHIIILFLFA